MELLNPVVPAPFVENHVRNFIFRHQMNSLWELQQLVEYLSTLARYEVSLDLYEPDDLVKIIILLVERIMRPPQTPYPTKIRYQLAKQGGGRADNTRFLMESITPEEYQ